jgi:hypothetical protein
MVLTGFVDAGQRGLYVVGMRWDALFQDLESQLQAATDARQESEVRDRTRAEQARVTLLQRLAGQMGRPVGVSTKGGRSLTGVLTNVGSQWIALAVEERSVIVPLSSVQVLRSLGRSVGQPLAGIEAKLGLGSALRALSRDRAHVALWVASPSSRYAGVIDRVGADFVDLGLVAPGDERRSANIREVLTVPFASIDTLESAAQTE